MLVIDKVPPADLSLDAVIERLLRMVIAGLRTRANQAARRASLARQSAASLEKGRQKGARPPAGRRSLLAIGRRDSGRSAEGIGGAEISGYRGPHAIDRAFLAPGGRKS
jgi:hypothetical protein